MVHPVPIIPADQPDQPVLVDREVHPVPVVHKDMVDQAV